MYIYTVKIVFILLIIKSIFCLAPNSLFDIKSKVNDSETFSATYNFYRLQDDSFNLLEYLRFNLIITVDLKNHSFRHHSLLVKYDDQIFNITTDNENFEKNAVENMSYVYIDFEIGFILNMNCFLRLFLAKEKNTCSVKKYYNLAKLNKNY